MRIAVLFDGAGLSRLGLEQAGHECVGFELDPNKHWLSKFIGSGNCELADVKDVDLSGFDAIWASPPCQLRSSARTQAPPIGDFSSDMLQWSLNLKGKFDVLWVENVMIQGSKGNDWGVAWNAAQFTRIPIQNRNRIIGGKYKLPKVYRPWKKFYSKDICPCVTASEFKGFGGDKRRASRFYGRRLTIEECAYHQGLEVPDEWRNPPPFWGGTLKQWEQQVYQGIGNGVPVFLTRAFGICYPPSSPVIEWICPQVPPGHPATRKKGLFDSV